MKHRCQKCQRVFRVIDYRAGEAYICEACGGRLHTLMDGADPRLVHGPDLELFQPESLLGQAVGPYRLLRVLGSGGAGAVYLGVGPGAGEGTEGESEAAVKILHPRLAADRRAVHRFLREGRTVGRLEHPALLRLLDSGEVETKFGKLPYLATEYAPGGSLAGLAEKGLVEPRRALSIIRGVAAGLAAAHREGIVHRDVKPGNIVLDREDKAKITDFGIAQVDGSVLLTSTSALLGTPHYMAPEQATDDSIDTRADVYSLGATFYHLLAGRPPFMGRLLNVLRAHVKDPPLPPSQVVPGLPPGIDAVVLRMLAKRPQDRYPSMEALIEDLDLVLLGKSPRHAMAAPSGGSGESGGRKPRRTNPAIAAFLGGPARIRWGAILLALVWCFSVAWFSSERPRGAAGPLAGSLVLAVLAWVLHAARLGRGHTKLWPPEVLASLAGAGGLLAWGILVGPGAFAIAAATLPVVLAAALLASLANGARAYGDARVPSLPTGASFPNFLLVDPDGYPVSRRDLAGQPALLLFFCGGACAPCLAELALLARRQAPFLSRGIRVAAASPERPAALRALRARMGVDFPLLSDSELDLARKLGIAGEGNPGKGAEPLRPSLFLLDGHGVLAWSSQPGRRGTRPGVGEALAAIETHLPSPPAPAT
ncbi:MAG: protein kinase [Planctomycetes bacterium]|nr:protein kinase [Planctomycetota bacterium]